MLRIDFHNHTKYSKDSMTEPKALAARAAKLGIVPAITDHSSIGAHKAMREAGAAFIPGEEIKTDAGDLIGLYVNELIPKETPFMEALDLIRGQGALAYLPHMYDVTRAGISDPKLAGKVDIIEIFNARSVMKNFNHKAGEFAKANKIPGAAGSDSHFLWEFGTTYTELPEFDIGDPKALMRALRGGKARIIGKSAPLHVKGTTTLVKLWKKALGKNI